MNASLESPASTPEGRLWTHSRRYLPAVLLAWFALQAAGAMVNKSVTVDEFAHLPSGVCYLEIGKFKLFSLSPPLVRMVAAAPLVASGSVDASYCEPAESQWEAGYRFVSLNAAQYHEFFVWARLMMVLLGVLLGVLVFVWARGTWGEGGAVLSLALYASSPTLLAHTGLVTTDVGCALAFAWTLFQVQRWLVDPSRGRAAVGGVALGVALLTKFTALLLIPLGLVLVGAAVYLSPNRREAARRLSGHTLLLAAVALLVVNLGYGFHGSFTPLRDFDLHSGLLQALSDSPLGRLPLPLPSDFVGGFDAQRVETEGGYHVYFLGEVREQGWAIYYVAALFLKEPLGGLLLLLLGGFAALRGVRTQGEGWTVVCTVVPALALIAAMSLLTDVNLGLRYILPALPLLFVAAGAWVKGAAFRRRGVRWLTAGLIGAALLSTGAQFPHYIGAFNVLAGGPQNGHQWLAHSNLDWGQDLPLLQEYMENEQIEEVDLAYYGRVPPEAYGIQFRPAPLSPEPGRVTAISANYALGLPYLLYVPGEEGLVWMPPHAFSSYAEHTPTRVLGRSLYLYDWRER